jgi:LDH2 family malate/lactate/ureidoglycolate dehydrogenase
MVLGLVTSSRYFFHRWEDSVEFSKESLHKFCILVFRRWGENEFTAIDTCHALVQASKQPGSNTTEVDRVAQYARSLINAQPVQIRSSSSN